MAQRRDHLAAIRDWLAGSDPGLLRLMTAAQAVVTIGLALLAAALASSPHAVFDRRCAVSF
jgi:hypothetical protein